MQSDILESTPPDNKATVGFSWSCSSFVGRYTISGESRLPNGCILSLLSPQFPASTVAVAFVVERLHHVGHSIDRGQGGCHTQLSGDFHGIDS
jgi:hypothetical protein